MTSILDVSDTYYPPDFRLFKKSGRGLVWHAKFELSHFEIDFEFADKWINGFEAKTAESRFSGFTDLFSLYANLSSAKEAIDRLETMEEKELKKHIELDGPCDIEALAAKFDEISGYLRGWEKRQPELIQQTLNQQMGKALNDFEAHLKWAEEMPGVRPYITYEDEPMDSISDFASMRGKLEYFRLTMQIIRPPMIHENLNAIEKTGAPAFWRLPDIEFDRFNDRLSALDDRFKTVLGDRRAEGYPAFWSDPEFWWDHPPKKQQQH